MSHECDIRSANLRSGECSGQRGGLGGEHLRDPVVPQGCPDAGWRTSPNRHNLPEGQVGPGQPLGRAESARRNSTLWVCARGLTEARACGTVSKCGQFSSCYRTSESHG